MCSVVCSFVNFCRIVFEIYGKSLRIERVVVVERNFFTKMLKMFIGIQGKNHFINNISLFYFIPGPSVIIWDPKDVFIIL